EGVRRYGKAEEPGTKYISQGIKWKAMLPAAAGFGGPVVVGGANGKIFLQSEPTDLVCLDAATGKILWIRSNHYSELATEEEKQANPEVFKEIKELHATLQAENESIVAGNLPKLESVDGGMGFRVKIGAEKQLTKLMKDIDDTKYMPPRGQDVGYSGLTPVTDGKHVWAWFATGVTCCYDLDGKLIWRRLDNGGHFFEHGHSSSPLLVDGKIIVCMNKVMAFDALTGTALWSVPLEDRTPRIRFHGTPTASKIGETPVIVLPPGLILRVSDGKVFREQGPEFAAYETMIPSPVVMGNSVYSLSSFHGVFAHMTLPEQIVEGKKMAAPVRTVKMDMSDFPHYYLEWFLSSPLIHDGLAYCMNNSGVLNVVDLKSMELVYQKLLDLDHFQNTHEAAGRGVGISPSLAGGNIYLVGNFGTTLVLKPGRTYEQLAKNKIESVLERRWGIKPERFVAAPTFVGKNMFLRGERYLYCIGE
ncbi:MAG: PQQ-binding-like beta-propeller repeat protein, partial [Phycisphaerales bacterium]|nr:PQQ-binding-like beta-propeller repeat protein [Phycisphaerales bacterium]